MVWIFVIVILLVFLFLLFNFPKQTLGFLAIAVLAIVGLIYYWIYLPSQEGEEREKERARYVAKVTVAVNYNSKECEKDFPLAIIITNGSQRTINDVEWTIGVFRPGYSSNLAGYENDYSSDKILAPGERWRACYRLPPTLETKRLDTAKL
jgi:c-di-AMP phosphodiesterase-like protein